MPTRYYESPELPRLTSLDFGKEPTPKKFEGIALFRIFLDIGLLGLSFTGIGVIPETIAGLAVGGVNEAIDISQHRSSAYNTIINFGLPLIAGGFVARGNAALVRNTKFGIEAVEEARATSILAEEANILIKAGLATTQEEAAKLINAASAIDIASITTKEAINNGARIIENQLIDAGLGLSRRQARRTIQKLTTARSTITKSIAEATIDYKVQKRILRTIGFNTEEVESLLTILNRTTLSEKERFSAVLGFIRNVDILTDRRTDFKAFLTAWERGRIALNEAYQIPLARQLTRLANKNFTKAEINNLAKAQQKESVSFFKRWFKTLKDPGSRDFNDYVVQPTQALFDANDAGRAPIEFLYRQLKKGLGKQFRKLDKLNKEIKDYESVFLAAGGIKLDSSWILGYTIVEKSPVVGGQNLIRITFDPRATYGKAPVFVWATDRQIEKFVIGTGSYYLRHWAYSRGGKSLSLNGIFGSKGSVFKVNRMARSVLGFIPVQALRNILSLTSNVVENVYSAAKSEWSKEWVSKFKGSFARASLNRPIRLFTREIAGKGWAGAKYGRMAGNLIGKELQRIGTNVFAPSIRKYFDRASLAKREANGTLTRGERTRLRNLRKNGIFPTRGKLATTFATGIKSNVRALVAQNRGRQNSVALQILSGRRKLQQVNRIPNAIKPGRPYKGGRFQKK